MSVVMAILLMLTGLTCRAKEQGNRPAIEKDKLVTAEVKEKVTGAALKRTYGQLAAYIKNGYTAYRITYNTTDTEGKEIVASGAIFVPDISTALPLFNYNHGTY